MNRKQQSRQHNLRCHFCNASIPFTQLVSHQTQCSIQQRKRNSQRPHQQQQQQQQRNQQAPRQQRTRQRQNINQVFINQSSDDSLDNDSSNGFEMPDFNQIFGPNSQFQRSMNNMARQMNQAFNINLNIGQNICEVNIQNGNQQFHYVNNQPNVYIQRNQNIINFPHYYESSSDDDDDGNHQEIHVLNFNQQGFTNQFFDSHNGQHQNQYFQEEEEQQGRPLNKRQIKNIPVQKYTKNNSNKNCIVCLTDFKLQDKIKILDCCHTFHSQCIDQWLQQKGECPICRHIIN